MRQRLPQKYDTCQHIEQSLFTWGDSQKLEILVIMNKEGAKSNKSIMRR